MNEGEPIKAFNIVTLPDAGVTQEAIRLSKILADKFDTAFVLGGTLLPHLTLYLAQYPTANLESLRHLTEQTAREITPFDINLKGYRVVSGFVFWNAEKNPELVEAHNKILNTLLPFRAEVESYIPLTGLTRAQEEAFKKYGNISAGSEYMPHITLTRILERRQEPAAIRALPKIELAFRVDNIALAVGGPNGTCSEIIEKFLLRK